MKNGIFPEHPNLWVKKAKNQDPNILWYKGTRRGDCITIFGWKLMEPSKVGQCQKAHP
jgi:hypothetical protein